MQTVVASPRPLDGVRVVEMSHVVMGPFCGMVLAQLGAEVIKVEPLDGDPTRQLKGMAISFFPLFNAGKKSVSLNLKSDAGLDAFHRLLETADVFIENFKDGTLDAMGISPSSLSRQYPELIVASHKGFLSGPYEKRPALDEVVQMMTGLAVMTGSRENPLRVGASMNDMMAGLFGVVAILSQLYARGRGKSPANLRIGLFENCLLAVAQHVVQFQITGEEPPPLSQRVHAWPVYDRFTTEDGRQIFIAATTQGHWRDLCEEFGLYDLQSDRSLQTVVQRVKARDRLVPMLEGVFAQYSFDDLSERLERRNLPFAAINSPADLLSDQHVLREGGLIDLVSDQGPTLRCPALPIEFDGAGLTDRLEVPSVGEHNAELFFSLGYSDVEIADLTVEAPWA